MPTDYQRICSENVKKYGTEVGRYGPTLLTHLYSERTHFLYELLQNAEDALSRLTRLAPSRHHSKKVVFHLFEDRLEFRNLGKLFDEADIEGVCGLAAGTATGDPNRIGKFGIGFKSVYAYTSSPEIHSGDEHFRISDYVCPTAAAETKLTDGETLFIFPFNSPEITREVAFREIATRLRELGLHTLLFLRQIEEIQWKIGDEVGTYRRESSAFGSGRLVKLVGQTTTEEWLLFSRPLESEGKGEGNVKIAFRVEEDSESHQKRVVPNQNSLLAVFFPTKIETKLSFLIQAPYITTPTRETIREDNPRNKNLVAQTAVFTAEILREIREMGLVTVGFLESLPIRTKDFPDAGLFRPIYVRVRRELNEQDLLPTNDGKFVPARRAKLASTRDLRELLSNEQLTALSDSIEPLKWLSDEITEGKTRQLWEYLTKEMNIETITPEKLAQRLSEEFLSNQSDGWMAKLYAFFKNQPFLWQDYSNAPGLLRRKPFIRLECGKHVPPFAAENAPNVYLPPTGQTDFPIVKRAIAEDKDALSFLQKLGLKEPALMDEVLENVLPKYQAAETQPLSAEEHQRDLETILSALQDDLKSTESERLEKKLKETSFVRGVNLQSGKTANKKPSELYLRTEPLKLFFSTYTDAWFVDESINDAT